MTTNADSIENAKARLKKAKDKIDANHQQTKEKEPKHLRSGHLDELEILRRKKGVDDE